MYAHPITSEPSSADVTRTGSGSRASVLAASLRNLSIADLLRRFYAGNSRPPMSQTAVQHLNGIEWSVASRALPGQVTSGDLHVVAPTEQGVLAGVVDGLGHGEEATEAAKVAVDTLARHAHEPVIALVQRCHEALRSTRGVVMSLVVIDRGERTLSSIGVGNVETWLFRANPRATPRREGVLLRGGVVGYQLPKLQSHVTSIAAGDVVVFATDGVREDFGDTLTPAEPVAQIVERIIAEKFRGTDDGLVLALKYTGSS